MTILDVQKQCALESLSATYEFKPGLKYIAFLSPREFRDPEKFAKFPDGWDGIDILFIAMSSMGKDIYAHEGRDLTAIIRDFLKEQSNVLTA